MALMDNKAFLISHIQNSFITSDETGMCELIIENEEHRERPVSGTERRPTTWHGKGSTEDLSCDSLDHSSLDSDTELSHSFDIVADMDFASHRRRSNTAQRLEKLKRERHQKSQIRHIQWKKGNNEVSEISEYFEKKPVAPGNTDNKQPSNKGKKSALSLQLEKMGPKINNPFADYAKFDGKASGGVGTKKIEIFLTMASAPDRPYPMTVVTLATAKIEELIGLICWQYYNENRMPLLQESVECYSLHIAEDDGEVDLDFPALDVREPIAKFGFSKLALVEREVPRRHMSNMVVTINIPDKGFHKIPIDDDSVLMKELLEKVLVRRKLNLIKGLEYRLERQADPGSVVDLEKPLRQMTTLDFCLVRQNSTRGDLDTRENLDLQPNWVASLSSHQYKSYLVTLLHKIGRNNDVQLGVSGEKVEVDPVQGKGLLFKHKATTLDMEDIVSCTLLDKERPSGKTRFRLVYSGENQDFKHFDFEGKTMVAREIVKKINNIMELRVSPKTKEYLARKEKKLHNPFRRHSVLS